MPYRSGLYVFLKMGFRDGLSDVQSINELHPEKTPALIVFADAKLSGSNLFAAKKFIPGTGRLRPHLRIDRDYESSKSDIQSRRNLSYCHATDYYVCAKEIIEVHYYFDRWGCYTHSMCKIKLLPVSDTMLWKVYEPSSEERYELRDRAAIFGTLIGSLLDAKNTKYLELSKEIQDIYNNISEKFMSEDSDKRLLNTQISRLKKIVADKNDLDDHGQDVRLGMFLRSLDRIESQKRERERMTSISPTDSIMSASSPKSTISTSSSFSSVSTDSGKSAKEKHAKNKQAENAQIAKEIVESEQLLAQIKITLTKINNEQNKSITDSGLVKKYIEDLLNLREIILILNVDERMDKKFHKKVEALWNDINGLPNDIKMFTQGLQAGDVNIVATVFPYCKETITAKLYDDSVREWFSNAMAGKTEMVRKQEKVFDFLSDNCSLFSSYIRDKTRIFNKVNDKILCSIMFQAFACGDHGLFAALLRYGINPFTPWLYEDNTYKKAMRVLVENPTDTDFYVKELIKYGVTMNGNEPYSSMVTLNTMNKLAASATGSKKKQLDAELETAAKLLVGLKLTSDNAMDHICKPVSIAKDFSPLSSFTANIDNFFAFPKLYGVLLDNSDLIEQLASLSKFVISLSSVSVLMHQMPTPGVFHVTMQDLQPVLWYEILPENRAMQIKFVINGFNKEEVARFCVDKLLLAIKRNLVKSVDITAIAQQLKKRANILQESRPHEAALYSLAVVLLYAFTSKFTPSLTEEYMVSMARAGDLMQAYIEEKVTELRAGGAATFEDQNFREKISRLTRLRKVVYSNICKLYLDALNVACFDSTNALCKKPDFISIESKLKAILDGTALEKDDAKNLNRLYQILLNKIRNNEPSSSPRPSAGLANRKF